MASKLPESPLQGLELARSVWTYGNVGRPEGRFSEGCHRYQGESSLPRYLNKVVRQSRRSSHSAPTDNRSCP